MISSEILFNRSEVALMKEPFKKQFKDGGRVARVKKSCIGFCAITYHRNGYNIEVTGSDIKELKKEFIQAVNNFVLKVG